ncbi:uncharacterized protein LOC128677377 [Plodia interpunctella]|uniref:uncharacterized protein LOC128677377 n=1 Tax=Plodia interpunctella TaxID=58824 RepID=UPI00236820D1|nr:uncharacterized protein LOC128677377 [Plodia interpunctella]
MHRLVPCLVVMLGSVLSIRINFTNCQTPEWTCINSVPNEIIYNCHRATTNDFIIHIKDYYTDHIKSVIVQNCRDLRVVLDCPLLQRASQLERFKIKDCDRLEFISLSTSSLLQTPPEVTIENVREIVSLPRNSFKSPVTNTELKCLGSTTLKKLRIFNSKINTIKTKAIHNVTGIKVIEFENVTVSAIENNAIETFMDNDESLFSIRNSKIENIGSRAITVRSKSVSIINNDFDDVMNNVLNITADDIRIVGNIFKAVNGLTLKSVSIDMSYNTINTFKSNALTNVKCIRKRTTKRQFVFTGNIINAFDPYSIIFEYSSCKSFGGSVVIKENRIDCKCRNIAFLQTASTNKELNNLILDATSNNTCLNVPCSLPVDVVRLLLESRMCDLNLDSQVMCLLYNDRLSNNEVTTDEDVTLPTPTFYLIRAANSQNGDASAAMTAIDKDDILKESNLNMTNRTTVKIVFDSSRDFVETLRSTGSNKENEIKPKEDSEHRNKCVGEQCKSIFINDRQKALDFYKYVYAQLRSPLHSTDKTKT